LAKKWRRMLLDWAIYAKVEVRTKTGDKGLPPETIRRENGNSSTGKEAGSKVSSRKKKERDGGGCEEGR